MHEQKFKDFLSSICHISPERSVLDLESEARCSILTAGNILSLEFLFSYSKASAANISITANFV